MLNWMILGMSNKELIIIGRALRKAFDNGWSYKPETPIEKLYMIMIRERVYFTHDFAKAIWGEEYPVVSNLLAVQHFIPEYWKYMLSRMVIADDPIAYLGENLYDKATK
jgi:hypothetical protein